MQVILSYSYIHSCNVYFYLIKTLLLSTHSLETARMTCPCTHALRKVSLHQTLCIAVSLFVN